MQGRVLQWLQVLWSLCLACFGSTLLLSTVAAVLSLSFTSRSWSSPSSQHLQCSVLALFSSAASHLLFLFIISTSSQFLCIIALFCASKFPCHCATYLLYDPGISEETFCSLVCVHPNVKPHTGTVRCLSCIQESWYSGTELSLCCLSALLAEREVEGKGLRAHSSKLPKFASVPSFFVKEKEDTEEKVLLCPCRPR